MSNPDILLTLKYNNALFADTRRIALLKAIYQTGSLSQAAKQIGISYKTAWDAINDINRLSDKPFFITATGGKGGGGTTLSDYAIRFIELYDLLTKMQTDAFRILKNETIPLNDVLKVAAKVSLQTSARNQLYGVIELINLNEISAHVTVLLQDQQTKICIYVTHASVTRLNLTVGKDIVLLIKAPQIELSASGEHNHYSVHIDKASFDQHWCELELLLNSGVRLYASRPIHELDTLHIEQGKMLDIYINPENIMIATLI